jgi:DNA-binding IclR family transcriptional regulator
MRTQKESLVGRDDPGGTQSVDRAVGVLRIVASRSDRGVRLVDVVERSGLSKPTAHRLLQALERQGLVAHDAAARLYHLGPEAFVIGTLAAERFGIQRAALPSLSRLALASQDTAFLSVRRDWQAVCLHREEGPFPIRSHVLQVGHRHPLGVGAGSLAILAALPDEEIEDVLAQAASEIEARYARYSPTKLREAVARTRGLGYALNPGLVEPESWGIGVAVLDQQGCFEGALSISAIRSRLSEPRQRELAALLRGEAQRLSDCLARPAGASDLASVARGQVAAAA